MITSGKVKAAKRGLVILIPAVSGVRGAIPLRASPTRRRKSADEGPSRVWDGWYAIFMVPQSVRRPADGSCPNSPLRHRRRAHKPIAKSNYRLISSRLRASKPAAGQCRCPHLHLVFSRDTSGTAKAPRRAQFDPRLAGLSGKAAVAILRTSGAGRAFFWERRGTCLDFGSCKDSNAHASDRKNRIGIL